MQPHLRHIQHKHSPKCLRHLQVIRSAQSLTTKVLKGKFRDLATALWDDEGASPSVQFAVTDRGVGGVRGCQGFKDLGHFEDVGGGKWVVVYM